MSVFAVLAVATLVLTACSDNDGAKAAGAGKGGSTTTPEDAGGPPTAESVALRQSDLPPGLVPCDYSGDLDSYARSVQARSEILGSYESVVEDAAEVKQAGAVRSYVTYFADNDESCNIIFKAMEHRGLGNTLDHGFEHPKVVFSFVHEFPTPAQAEAAYKADLFGQESLKTETELDVTSGDLTGLGPNSVTSNTRAKPVHIRQAVWQHDKFLIFAATDSISREESEAATAAMDARIR